MTALVSLDRIIESRSDFRDGRPYIAGTRVSVAWIAALLREGLTADAMVADVFEGHITAAQVHAAIAFYLLNQETIDREEAIRDAEYDRAAAANISIRKR